MSEGLERSSSNPFSDLVLLSRRYWINTIFTLDDVLYGVLDVEDDGGEPR